MTSFRKLYCFRNIAKYEQLWPRAKRQGVGKPHGHKTVHKASISPSGAWKTNTDVFVARRSQNNF